MKPYLVLDTNILLLDARNIYALGKDYTLVLPETVLDEVDAKKISKDPELRYQVREIGRILTKAIDLPIIEQDPLVIVPSDLDGIRIEVVSRTTYPPYDTADISVVKDRRIIQIALDYKAQGKDVTFMTNDIMCNRRAKAFGLNVIDLKIVDDKPVEFTREVTVDPELFTVLHNSHIKDVVPDHKPETYNYKFIDSFSGQVKLANLRGEYIDILGKETEAELRRQDATPQNAGQLFLSRAIQNPNVDIVVCEALAGSGKTVSAFSNAIRLVKKKEYGSITYIRASVDDVDQAEEIGFLSGNDEKLAVYLHPVQDTLDFIIRGRHKESKLKGKEFEEFISHQIEKLTEECNISSMIGLGLRGRTFTNTVAIIDEAQNMSKSSLQKVLTRFGKDCKIIVIGSNKQIDNRYITKYTNGLSILMDACRKEHDNIKLHAVPLTKVLRSNIAEFAEDVFSNSKV